MTPFPTLPETRPEQIGAIASKAERDSDSPPERSRAGRLLDPQQTREEAAGRVALLVVVLFGGFLLLACLGGIGTLCLGVWLEASFSGDAQVLLQSYGALVESLGKASTALFGPLLGFILGHYFGRSSRRK